MSSEPGFEPVPATETQGGTVQVGQRDLDAVYDIPVQVSAVLGRATMQVSQLLKLGRGAVVELDRKLGEAVEIYVNNRLVARGDAARSVLLGRIKSNDPDLRMPPIARNVVDEAGAALIEAWIDSL